ncbi:MAG: response regulator [Verrucomicrobiota bacterium]|jgi:CheY-like chemotaxis protein
MPLCLTVSGNKPAGKKHILIADDDPSIRYMLGRVLLDEGYEVTAAADGEEGLKIAASQEIDLMLLDLKTPGMSGQDTLRALALSRPALPVIVITAYARQQLGGGLAGVSAVLQKPLDFFALLATIQKLLAGAAAVE